MRKRVIYRKKPIFLKLALYAKQPSKATEYRSFELDSERGRCECVSVEERRLWTARFRFTTKNNLCWFYDVAMIEENGRLLFGIKIEISTEIPLEEAQAQLPLVTELLSNIEEDLKKFLKDARLNIDNNPAERLNRGIAIIRKNCLFAGSEAGGQRLALLYSFAATCKANGICFREWLEDVLPRLNSTPAGQIDSLIPGAKQRSQ